jgi:hypothetical protein
MPKNGINRQATAVEHSQVNVIRDNCCTEKTFTNEGVVTDAYSFLWERRNSHKDLLHCPGNRLMVLSYYDF